MHGSLPTLFITLITVGYFSYSGVIVLGNLQHMAEKS